MMLLWFLKTFTAIWKKGAHLSKQPLKEAVAVLSRLNSSDTSHRDAVLELAFAFSVTGVLSENVGEKQDAEQAFAEAERLFQRA